jgi:hypothetical protein
MFSARLFKWQPQERGRTICNRLITRGSLVRRSLPGIFAAIGMIALAGVARGQTTIDNDPDMAPGFTNSVFHTPSVDSINLYNGQITIPIAIGPSYPLGPKLKYQAFLTYNSYG